jgi:hypothetical protein
MIFCNPSVVAHYWRPRGETMIENLAVADERAALSVISPFDDLFQFVSWVRDWALRVCTSRSGLEARSLGILN